MGAELGQTTNPKELIPGEPEAISRDLQKLVGNVEKIGAVKDGLHGIDPKQWTGPASDAFRQVFQAVPPQWQDAMETLGDRAQSLADYGDVLTWAQREAQRAIEQYTKAQSASRAAAAQYTAQAQQAQAGGQTMAPFQDPGQAAAKEAQQILDEARKKVIEAGGKAAERFGYKKGKDGTYKKDLNKGAKEWGAEHRKKEKDVWDEKKQKWTKEDEGGWQKDPNRRFGSFKGNYGPTDQSDGLLGDKLDPVLKKFGIGLPESTHQASADAKLLHGETGGSFQDGAFSGKGKLEGSVLGADAGAHAGTTATGVNAGANAEAYLAKGHAEGEVRGGPVAAKGSADGMVGADGKAEGKVGLTGAQGSAEAFAGARVSGDASASVAGIGAGVHGEAWAGAGAQASGQFGMGDDGKFHVGASLGVGLGVGAKLGFNTTVDPTEVEHSVEGAAKDVGHVASDIGHGVGHAADKVGHALGF